MPHCSEIQHTLAHFFGKELRFATANNKLIEVTRTFAVGLAFVTVKATTKSFAHNNVKCARCISQLFANFMILTFASGN